MNKKSLKRTIGIIINCVVIYVALVLILTAIESRAEGATITSISSAFWYSITTLTTVGYGDTYPVTGAGRVIGVVFQILSLGVLAAIVGMFLSLLRGTLVPASRLRLRKKKIWHVFNEKTPSSEKLAAHLLADDPDSVNVFCGRDSSEKDENGICVALSSSQVLALKGKYGKSYVFFMSENMSENEINADSIKMENVESFIMSDHEPTRIKPHQHLFNPYENSARLYWHHYSPESIRETIVLIGEGKYADALLEQALILNVISDRQHMTYRMFGNFEQFQRLHPYLETVFSVGKSDPNRDSLFFQEKTWDADHSLLKKADRIIICFDEEEKTIDLLYTLRRYVPVTAKLYARLSAETDGCIAFGSDDEIFTQELVIKNKLSETAIRLHNTYLAASPGTLPDWYSLNPFLRRSNLAAADHLLNKIRCLLQKPPEEPIELSDAANAYAVFCSLPEKEEPETGSLTKERCRRMEHERWMRFHVINNWQYAPVRDNERRLHPLLLPFDELTPEDQAKDDYAWELLNKI